MFFSNRLKNIFSKRPDDPRRNYANLLIKEIKKLGWQEPFIYDAESFCLATNQRKKHILYLGNTFDEYLKATPRYDKQRVLHNAATAHYHSLADKELNFDSVRENLILTVRERCFFEFTKLYCEIKGSNPIEIETKTVRQDLFCCIDPERYLVNDFPSNEVLENMNFRS